MGLLQLTGGAEQAIPVLFATPHCPSSVLSGLAVLSTPHSGVILLAAGIKVSSSFRLLLSLLHCTSSSFFPSSPFCFHLLVLGFIHCVFLPSCLINFRRPALSPHRSRPPAHRIKLDQLSQDRYRPPTPSPNPLQHLSADSKGPPGQDMDKDSISHPQAPAQSFTPPGYCTVRIVYA